MQTRDQKYAVDAYDNVTAMKRATNDEKIARKYGVMCHRLPILIHTAGLAQALAFVDSRKDDAQKDNSRKDDAQKNEKQNIYKTFLKDLGKTVAVEQIVTEARKAELNEYMRLTTQVMEALVWYKRFAQSILGVDASDTEDEVE